MMVDTPLEVPPSSGIVQGSHVKSDPRSHQIDRLFFKRVWMLCRPYWTRKGAWRSVLVLIGILLSGMIGSAAGGALAFFMKNQNDDLIAKNVAGYWYWWFLLTGLGLVLFVTSTAARYASGQLNLNWRRWLTGRLIDDYLEHRTYYEITVDEDIDNPDQRIQEQVTPFIATMASLPQQLLNTSLNIGVQVAILMSISVPMLVATLFYIVFNMVVTFFVTRPTVRQNWEWTVAEADLRYGLLHVRDNAETIAFYRGETMERVHLGERLDTTIGKQARIVRYEVITSSVSQGTSLAWVALPMLLITPLFFQGKISFGIIGVGVMAATSISSSFSTLIAFIPQLSTIVPSVVRLAEIQEKFENLSRARSATATIPRIERRIGPVVEVDRCTLGTPGGEQTLFRDLSFVVKQGQHLLILGQTGVGKSSLLRAIAGLWTYGQGSIVTPSADAIMFLPQRPYMLLGTLRSQITYPNRTGSRQPSDEELKSLLIAVCLPKLLETHGGLDTVNDWNRILSLGEQQRIAFARVLLASPKYVFMDEATSAVDIETEEQLYGLLLASPVTMISVGHRPSLTDFHVNILDLRPEGSCVISSGDYTQMQSTRSKSPSQGSKQTEAV